MRKKEDKISDAELEVMRILWREKKPTSFRDIRAELNCELGWEKSTVATLLSRLQKKGFVTVHEREMHYYTPNISKEDYVKSTQRGLIDRLYEGSVKNFVAAFCQNTDFTESDLEELRRFFHAEDDGK